MKKVLGIFTVAALAMSIATSALAAPTKGKVLFQDDFSKDLSNWTYNTEAWKINDGKLEAVTSASLGSESDAMILLKTGTGWTNYAVDFDMWFGGDDAFVTGPIFLASDYDNLYMWQMAGPAAPTPNAVRKHIRKDASWAVEAVDIGIAFKVGTKYHVTYELYKGVIKSYIDGKLVDDTADDTFTSGTIGFRQWGEAQSFDNVLVTELK